MKRNLKRKSKRAFSAAGPGGALEDLPDGARAAVFDLGAKCALFASNGPE
jgi:hypothetical protein